MASQLAKHRGLSSSIKNKRNQIPGYMNNWNIFRDDWTEKPQMQEAYAAAAAATYLLCLAVSAQVC